MTTTPEGPGVRWRLSLGADRNGLALKDVLHGQLLADDRVAYLTDHGVWDVGDDTAYPDVAFAAAEAVARGEVDRAILVCGTGIGMAICANKVPRVRAAVAVDMYSVERCVLSNDCQVIALGAQVTGAALATRIVSAWLDYRFDQSSPSSTKIASLAGHERRHLATRTNDTLVAF